MLPHVLTAGKELGTYIHQFGVDVVDIVGVRKYGLNKLGGVNSRFHGSAENEHRLLHIVDGFTRVEMSVMKCSTDVESRSAVIYGSIEPSSAHGHALESRNLIVVGILGKHADIGVERIVVVAVGKSELTAGAQCHGRRRTRDEVIASHRSVARQSERVVEITGLERAYAVVLVGSQ